MRFVLILAFLLGSFAVAHAADVDFVRVWPEWRDAESFDRISEYFTGKENTGRETVRRSQVENRAGFYFVTRVRNNAGEQPAAKMVLSVIRPDAPQVRQYTFPVPLPRGETVYNLGLTGKDWPGNKARPVAWKLEVVSTDGTTLATSKSFLWEKPAK
ncbi:MAG: hypothetical protein JWM32_2175 [Verrucomicrobia bacterium]|nr:hypothetical protein [Verrucomicrobiota bacterium]